MAAELVAPEVMAAAVACVSFGSNAVAQVDAALVVNCAADAVLVPEAQFVVTLQSYKVEAARPVMVADVPVCAVEKLVQVPEAFSL